MSTPETAVKSGEKTKKAAKKAAKATEMAISKRAVTATAEIQHVRVIAKVGNKIIAQTPVRRTRQTPEAMKKVLNFQRVWLQNDPETSKELAKFKAEEITFEVRPATAAAAATA